MHSCETVQNPFRIRAFPGLRSETWSTRRVMCGIDAFSAPSTGVELKLLNSKPRSFESVLNILKNHYCDLAKLSDACVRRNREM